MTGTSIHKLNFGSGPAALPPEVLRLAAEAVIDYNDSGLSILEIPHRGGLFGDILEESKTLVKELCGLDDDYEVLWMQGGGRLQFCMIPMNFLTRYQTAGYIDSGYWASQAAQYALSYGNAAVIASSKQENYTRLPDWPSQIPEDCQYIHFTTNNTIYGTQWGEIPKTPVPLIADMSSDILSRRRDYKNCAMFYACVQKNIGPAGVTLVVIHKDLLTNSRINVPPMLQYYSHASQNSLLNTPPVFAIYTSLLMLRWTREKGIAAIEEESIRKSETLYGEIERNSQFVPTVAVKEHRSRMNVCFRTVDPYLEKAFSALCSTHHITGIEGHRSVGGFRVSLYNAVTPEAVEKLVALMQAFESDHQS